MFLRTRALHNYIHEVFTDLKDKPRDLRLNTFIVWLIFYKLKDRSISHLSNFYYDHVL